LAGLASSIPFRLRGGCGWIVIVGTVATETSSSDGKSLVAFVFCVEQQGERAGSSTEVCSVTT
jgi:hypothetical protein